MTRSVFRYIAALGILLTLYARAETTPQTLSNDTRIEQHLGTAIPPDLLFTDDQNLPVHLGDYFASNKPSILILAYYSCPNLCPVTLRHLIQGLNGIGMTAGPDFQVITISFDPRDTPIVAAERKREYLRGYIAASRARDAMNNGWHFLTGSQQSIDRIKEATGFHSTFDQRTHSFAHSAAVMILTPDGKLSHYFFRTDISPADLSSALHDAAANRSTLVAAPEQQLCVRYDPLQTARRRIITRTIQGAGALWAALLFGYIGRKLMTEFHARRTALPGAQSTSWGSHHA